MKKHISYPKIQQFRNIISTINREVTFIKLDENGEAIFDINIKKPILTFKGTVKLHGTNASVCYNDVDGFWIQSRKNIITIEKDNAAFAFFVEGRKDTFLEFIKSISKKYNIDTSKYTISIYGEWAGKGIQKGVGISKLEKGLYIFGIKISKIEKDDNFNSYWVNSSFLSDKENNIFNVEDFKTYTVDVDFNNPHLAQNKFIEITNEIEEECPVSKAFGLEKELGEGVVWATEFKGNIHRFKVKGEKHSVTKVKKLAEVDVEKINSILEFVDYAVTKNRFEQAIENIFVKENLDIKKLGNLIKWVISDIIAEETDTMTKNGIEPKEVNKYISNKVREMFFESLNKSVGL